MKRIRLWTLVLFAGAVLSSVLLITSITSHSVSALTGTITTEAINTHTQNGLYKVFYSNLDKCYAAMQGTISENEGSVWQPFNSNTYFAYGLNDDFLKFPYTLGTSNKSTSSCPGLIEGWNGWWSNKYSGLVGINKSASVPNSSYYDSDASKMGEFLQNIGYTKKTDTTTAGGLKCFYYRVSLNDSTFTKRNWNRPTNNKNFETFDFCVKMDGDYVSTASDGIVEMRGTKGYSADYGHATGDTNQIYIYFDTVGFTPFFDSYTVLFGDTSWSGKKLLQSNVTAVAFDYNGGPANVANTIINTKGVGQAGIANCGSLGYYWCSSVTSLGTKWIGSLTSPDGQITYAELKSRLQGVLRNLQDQDGVYLFSSVSAVDYTPGEKKYSKGSTSSKFIKYFIGNTSQYNLGRFSDAEKYILYWNYLKDYYGAQFTEGSVAEGVRVSWLQSDGTFKTGYVYVPSGSRTRNDEVYILSGNEWLGIVKGDWKKVANELAAINVESAFGTSSEQDPGTIVDIPQDPTASGGNVSGGSTSGGSDPGMLDGCMSNAGVLGWIMCPVIRLIGGAIQGIYSGVEGLLMVDANTVTDQATRDAWGQFQGYANIIFAIMLAIVILSQVTGIGLNNYNIKKILPRLIITIVLVNLSFIICSLAVDLSNILGVQLKEIFDRFQVTNQGIFDVDPGAFVRNTLESLLEVTPIVLGTGVAVSVIMSEELWRMMLLPLLLGFITMLISILFFFILLGVRQAAVIILLVVSPIAIICYTLPNTQKIFDRWLKMFSSLLLVYPICGLMMGGGQFMSRLLLNAGGSGMSFMYYLTAMLLSVVPFFFIPTVLKGSFTAMGNLGLKLSQMGSRVGNGITRGVRGSDWAREYQREQTLTQSRNAYERLNAREEAIRAAGGQGLNARDARRRSRYARQMLRLEAEDRRAGYNPGQVAAARRRQQVQQETDDISGRQELFTAGAMNSIIAGRTDPINGGSNDELADELDAYMDRIVTGTGTEDEIADDVLNAQALINALSDQGTSGARAKVEQSFARAMHRHQSIFGDSRQTDRLRNTFGTLAARTNAKYGRDYKKDSPGTAAMFGDIAQGNFSRAGTFEDSGRSETRYRDDRSRRYDTPILRSTHYGGIGAGVSGMNTEDFSKLKGYGAHNILDGIRAGQIGGSDARAAARMADEVLNSDVYTPDSDVRDILEQIRTAGYSTSGAVNGRNAGSLAMRDASTSALESMVGDISGVADVTAWNALDATQQARYRQLFDNIRETLNNDTLSAANADQLQQALQIAHDRGFTDASGNVISAFGGTPHLKIDHSASQPIVVPPVPSGWTEGGMWTGGGAGPSRQQEIAYQEWAKIKARADMQDGGGTP